MGWGKVVTNTSSFLFVLSSASLSAGEASPLVDVPDVRLHPSGRGTLGHAPTPEPDVTTPGSGGLGISEASLLVDVADVGMHVSGRGPLPHSVSSEPLVVHSSPLKF